MVNLTSGILDTNATNSVSLMNAKATGSVDAFAQQLESAIEGYLAKSGNGSHFEIDVTSPSGQNSAAGSQFTVTVKSLDPAPAATSGSTAPATAAAVTPSVTTATTNSGAASATSETALTAAQRAKMTPTDAYWASQPPAVQVLRTTPDDQKPAVAQQLANQGYAIDVPIMVWGWDPLATMIERQTAGYTWVPSALQPAIQEAPGIDGVVGATPYAANFPPAGSIPVTTAFAEGTNVASDSVAEMWMQGQSFTLGSPNTSTS
jgi:hypothetical protein